MEEIENRIRDIEQMWDHELEHHYEELERAGVKITNGTIALKDLKNHEARMFLDHIIMLNEMHSREIEDLKNQN
jgi:hypothetical protein